MRARVLVGEISVRNTGATRSGLIGKSSWESSSGPFSVSPALRSASLSGSMVRLLVCTVAEAAIAPAMISACTSKLCARASIRPARNCER